MASNPRYGNQRSNTPPAEQADPWTDNQVVTAARVNTHLANCRMRADGKGMVTGDFHGHAVFEQGYVKLKTWPIQVKFATPFTRTPGVMLHYRAQGDARTTDGKTGRVAVIQGSAKHGVTNPCQQATDDGVINAVSVGNRGFILLFSATGDNPGPATTVYWQAIGV